MNRAKIDWTHADFARFAVVVFGVLLTIWRACQNEAD